ncbi:hypothetical protein HN695_02460 [Candidatus Woesearchaeota archaeon]|jgi:hypothetical protein|nr:hypothetical protein [Candidatus Woesearchaeota archaeon]MBT5272948.1 hypothetical protein [Candidatus Woesearchaeota archaeon]MBT6041414.1 hypothetical protein [Candidatus Woesearchaeota archaeon]MBT6337297.1 hypothetical protein [Candidatus Woesearchaeota archaeon]MBT7927174.1 hypothetical protein [Candidatus Woesearchaeota archaeon]
MYHVNQNQYQSLYQPNISYNSPSSSNVINYMPVSRSNDKWMNNLTLTMSFL